MLSQYFSFFFFHRQRPSGETCHNWAACRLKSDLIKKKNMERYLLCSPMSIEPLCVSVLLPVHETLFADKTCWVFGWSTVSSRSSVPSADQISIIYLSYIYLFVIREDVWPLWKILPQQGFKLDSQGFRFKIDFHGLRFKLDSQGFKCKPVLFVTVFSFCFYILISSTIKTNSKFYFLCWLYLICFINSNQSNA